MIHTQRRSGHARPRGPRRPRRGHAIPLLAALGGILLLVGACAASTGDLGSVATPAATTIPSLDVPSSEPTPESPAPSSTAALPSTTPASPPPGTTTVRSYFFLGSFTDNAGLAPVLREVPHTLAVGATAMNALVAGPNAREMAARPAMYTDVPDGTRFLGLSISSGVATVNLSSEFASGGVASAVVGRYAQVVFTLTQFPTITGVRFELDGLAAPASITGSTVTRPVTRSDYTDQLPAIFVDQPAWSGVLGNPARVSGVANVFEAVFQLRILDSSGSVVADQREMASCGTGCWGSFDATVPYAVSSAQWGTLRVFDFSAKDGQPENVTDYPVWLTP